MATFYTNNNRQNVTYATLNGSAIRDVIPADTANEEDFFEQESLGVSSSADGISVDTTNFDTNLAATDNDLQKVVDKLDDLTVAAGSVGAADVSAGTFPVGGFSFQNDVSIGEDIVVSGDSLISGDMSVSGNSILTGNLSTSGTLSTTGNAVLSADVSVGGDLNLAGTLSGVGASEITVNAASFSGNLSNTDNTVQKVVNKLDQLVLSNSEIIITEYDHTEIYTYFGGTLDSNWIINRYNNGGVKTTANIDNNSGTADLNTAWTNRATLIYV